MLRTSLTVRAFVVLIAGTLPGPHAAWAQQASGIAGVARDATGAVLPGVTVEASSPALIEKVRSVVTDGEGRYNIVDLRPGTYTVTFTLAGFNTFRREGVELTAGFTANVNAELRVGALEETITVSGSTPLVDTQNVRQQNVVSNELVEVLPTGTMTVADIGAITPGLSGTVNVGGSAGTYSMNSVAVLNVHGKRNAKALYDGMRVNNMEGAGSTTGFVVSPNTLEEWTVETGGVSAESDASGVVVNYIPKEGGNSLSGNFSGLYTNDSLQSSNLSDELRARGLDSVNEALHIYSADAAIGGPIVRDRLWFFTATRATGSKTSLAGIYYNATQGTPFYTADLGRPGFRNDRLWAGAARVTWQVSAKNKLNFFTDFQSNTVRRGEFAAPEAMTLFEFWPQGIVQATWNAPLTSRLLLEAGAGVTISHWPTPVQPEVRPGEISILELSTGFRYNVGTLLGGPKDSDRYIQRFAVSYVTGSHAFKTGFQLQEGIHNLNEFIQEAVTYRFLRGVPNSLTQHATPYIARERLKADLGIYAQDQWTIRRLTLNYGLRFDYYNAYVKEQEAPASRFVPARSFDPVYHVPEWSDVNPRLGAAYDLFGDGRTAVKASIGRYVAAESVGLARAVNPLVTSVNQVTRTWGDADGNFVPDCDLLNPLTNGECGTIDNLNFGGTRVVTDYADDVLRGFGARPWLWDLATEVQHELLPRTSVTAGWYHNWSGNLRVVDNLEFEPSDFDPYCINAPSDARLPDGGGYQVCGLYDISPAKFGRARNLVTRASAHGDWRIVNDFFTVSFNSRLSADVQLGGGLDTGRNVNERCFVVDSPQDLLDCRVVTPFSAQTQLKLYGSYRLPGDIQVAAIFQNSSGPQQLANYPAPNSEVRESLGRDLAACRGAAACTATPSYVSACSIETTLNAQAVLCTAQQNGVPLVTPQTQFEGRRTQLDLRFAKHLRLNQNLRVELNVDIYNVFNDNAVMAVNNTYGSQWLRPISDAYTGGAILAGRLLQFGGRVRF
jgi:hypothetical protein